MNSGPLVNWPAFWPRPHQQHLKSRLVCLGSRSQSQPPTLSSPSTQHQHRVLGFSHPPPGPGLLRPLLRGPPPPPPAGGGGAGTHGPGRGSLPPASPEHITKPLPGSSIANSARPRVGNSVKKECRQGHELAWRHPGENRSPASQVGPCHQYPGSPWTDQFLSLLPPS